MPRNPEHERLVADFLGLLVGLSEREAAALEGVPITHERIRQLRADKWTRLNAETARALRAYVEVGGAVSLTGLDSPTDADLYELARKAAAFDELAAIVDRVRSTGPSESEIRKMDRARDAMGGTTERERGTP